MRYLSPEAVLALVPGNYQGNAFNIRVVLQCIATECIVFSSLYGNGLINPDCIYSIGVQGDGMSPAPGWRFDQ